MKGRASPADFPKESDGHMLNKSSRSDDSESTLPRERCTPCKIGFRLMEGPPDFFLATNPSAEQLQAFKAFSANAAVIRHEHHKGIQERNSGSGAESAAPTSTRSIHRFRGPSCSRPAKENTSSTASVHADNDHTVEASFMSRAGEASPQACPTAEDTYPEVPELGGSIRLLRYLQGYEYNVPAASEAYRRHMRWREEMGICAGKRRAVVESMLLPMHPEAAPSHADVTRFFPTNPVLRRNGVNTSSTANCDATAAPVSLSGEGDFLLHAMSEKAIEAVIMDKQGNIISIERPGLLDVNGLFSVVSEDDFLRWHSYMLEFRCMLLDVWVYCALL
ncbi:phosphatidylinositol transfer-like protein [Cyclospora cayetanensis]|uniref:Phosphatidylinositol transfer-like protein n=1 Tax=Cyclospora cayetanensis TaxID=88456 RepID=A0A1D3D3U7_9EIME|nr:phosphatidylinositol transfer-like protein [Cyclospora cayetanensis]